jgi:hypothetical protein
MRSGVAQSLAFQRLCGSSLQQAQTSCFPRPAAFLVGTWKGTQTRQRRRSAPPWAPKERGPPSKVTSFPRPVARRLWAAGRKRESTDLAPRPLGKLGASSGQALRGGDETYDFHFYGWAAEP